MTHKDYLDWLTSEISETEKVLPTKMRNVNDFLGGALSALRLAKEKFLTIDFSHSPAEENENNFTSGLEDS